MAVFRIDKTRDYTVMSNHHFRNNEYRTLTEDKENLYAEYKKAKAETTEIDIVKSNVDSLLGASHKLSRDISAHLEQ